jgi:Flp pilus assembly protein TadD
MRGLLVSILVLAAIGSASGVAIAQPGLSTGMNTDGIDRNRRIEEDQKRTLDKLRKAGLEALQAQNFALAEKSFGSLLEKNPTTNDANYLMGITQLGLQKWLEASQYLQLAVRSEPDRPEPKGRLAVAYIMIGNVDSAREQRTILSDMAGRCSGCADAKKINDNVAMIDKVLAAIKPKPATAPAG